MKGEKVTIKWNELREKSGGATTKTSFRTGKHKSPKDYDRNKSKQQVRKELENYSG